MLTMTFKGGAYKKPKRTTMKFLKVNLLEIQILCSNWTPVTTKRGVNKIYATLSSTFPRETWVSFSNGNMLTVPKDNSYSAKHIEHICNEWVGICVRESSLRFVSKLPLASTAPPFQLDFMECLVIQVLFVATYKFTPQTNHQMKIWKLDGQIYFNYLFRSSAQDGSVSVNKRCSCTYYIASTLDKENTF